MNDPLTVGATLAFEHATARVTAVLAAAGIRAIVIKGPIQANILYGAPLRASRDIDLVVSPASVSGTEQVLADRGYRRVTESTAGIESDHAHMWVATDRPTVDLHWSFVGADPARFWDVLSSSTRRLAVGDAEVEAPTDDALALIVALHAAQHGVADIAAIDDLDQALSVIGPSTWASAGRLADEAGATVAFAAGLGLAPAGAALLETLGWSPSALPAATALNLGTPPPTADGFLRLDSQRGPISKLRFLGTKLFPSAAFMSDKYRIAERGHLGLALAYVYRPLWLARWAPQGYLAWRRAKRSSERSRR